MNSIFAKISSRENISNSLSAKFSSRENKVLYSIYVCLIPQPHMLSKQMTAFRVLIVTYVDAIEEFMQPGNCYN